MLAKSPVDQLQSCHDVAGELKNWQLKNANDPWKSNHPEIFEADINFDQVGTGRRGTCQQRVRHDDRPAAV
tara:strand:+ start:78667 stop:78879 length:213 start_codon:yes stop_codon:yes gene_type:complete